MKRSLHIQKTPRVARKREADQSDSTARLRETEQPDLLAGEFARRPVNYADDLHRYRKNGAREKVLGAVYTPPRVAAALTRWAVRSAADCVLDPSCGEGVFLSAARTRLADLGARKPVCIGVDIDPATAQQTGAVCADFFAWLLDAPKVDVILGNPPFIRSHLFPETSRTLAFAAMERMRLRPSRLMSTWAPFLALSCAALTAQGRLAMVIPEELLAVGYAEELRRFLLRRFRRVIVCFPDSNVFPDVQQAVVLLLCDNDESRPHGLLTIGYADLEEGNFDALEPAPVWEWNAKWSHLFLAPAAQRKFNDWWPQLGWEPISSYGRVEVGIVTGDNGFFILNADEAKRFSPRHVVPILASARDLRGIRFDTDDFNHVAAAGRPAYLLNLREPQQQLDAAERAYVRLGEDRHVSQRYKCRIRKPWYAVPSVWEPHAVLLRQAGDMARLVHLAKRCAATDTIHRVTWSQPSKGRRHAASFLNTWTLLATELTGRSYGGGVLELMPGEANRLPLPEPLPALDEIFADVDARVRARDFHAARELVDDAVLPAWLTSDDRSTLSGMLNGLIQRRKTRAS